MRFLGGEMGWVNWVVEERKAGAEEVQGVLVVAMGVGGWMFCIRSKTWLQWVFFSVRR
jgi:hypothetical protein